LPDPPARSSTRSKHIPSCPQQINRLGSLTPLHFAAWCGSVSVDFIDFDDCVVFVVVVVVVVVDVVATTAAADGDDDDDDDDVVVGSACVGDGSDFDDHYFSGEDLLFPSCFSLCMQEWLC
jgi:hypothetical protein